MRARALRAPVFELIATRNRALRAPPPPIAASLLAKIKKINLLLHSCLHFQKQNVFLQAQSRASRGILLSYAAPY
jgi:hypothetical protein